MRHTHPLFPLFPVFSFYILYYRKRGSASYIVREVLLVRERERYREREIDGSDVTIVALKLAMNFPCQKFAQLAMSLHFPLPKIRTFRFSLHTSRLSLHGEVTMVALKFAMSSHFPLPKNFFALRLCSPSFEWHEERDE